MDKLKRFIDCYIPTETCNFRCSYCYIAQQRKFNNKLAKFNYPSEIVKKALSIKRLGGICLINLCAGGETLLSEEVISAIKALLEEGHYVMVVTNGSLSKRFDEIAQFDPKLLKRLFFKFSFHYLELVRLNLMEQYFNNVKKMQKAGCSFTIEMTPNDELIPYIDDIKKVCMKNLGTLCHVTIARDDRTKGIEVLSKYSFEDYKKIWSTFESSFFDFKSKIFYKKRTEFCYAGDWSLYINLVTGAMRQCYCGRELDNIYKNIDKPLNFCAIGYGCTQAHCYNGHAFLTIGDIPELETPTYAKMREHSAKGNAKKWLKPEMEAFMNQKLKDNNVQYTKSKKRITMIKNKADKVIKIPKRIIKKLYVSANLSKG